MRQIRILNRTHPLKSPLVVGFCERFLCKLRGLALRRELAVGRGLVLASGEESRVNSAIHMLGMAFDLSIAWLDSSLIVVDVQPARRWRSFLIPRKASRYVIEFHALRLEEFHIGDQISFEENPVA